MRTLIVALAILCFLHAQVVCADHNLDSVDGPVKTVKELKDQNPKVGDKITKKHAIVWDDLVDDEGNKISVIRGTTQHHLINGNQWRTVIDIEGKRYKGTSTHTNGDWSMTVQEVEE